MKNFSSIILCLTIALILLATGYSAWNQTLNVSGIVTPGSLSATIDVGPQGLSSSAEYATIVEGTSTDTNLEVIIDNAAAGNEFTISYSIINSGSIPASISFTEPVISANGTGATASDISITTPQAPGTLEGGYSSDGSLTITINDTTPMTGEVSYTISIGISVSPP